ncbi:WD repeat domain phosphoinositide-interacting protein 2-like isoform X5 [Mytilus californianus]|uniref:WD repeat domain phosphoinositide-interacting protein 2-like isoform X5 n=1 Tax=Mytilus californianus TaxID=6549 RepID=UPI002246F728|nr:WD repeat domain phosphoinositide-interacting protein 2-like isoform X5 [Mytilus californianus]
MNLAIRSGDHPSDLLFVNFNQDCTSLAVGSKSWYRLYSLNTVDKLESIYENESEDVCIVERLFSSSLVAIVSISSPRKLKVCHFKKGTEICNYSYSNSILAVKLNRQRLIVCLEESLYIHNIRDMKVLHTIRDTPPNLTGLCALSINNDNCFLAYPGSNQIGEVQIFDTINLRAVTMIPAHDNPLAAIAFNAQGNRVATASEKGTVIRVFSVPDGQKLFEFRRGVKRCATIYSLAFSVDSMFLAASSSTETVHVFKLETPKDNKTEEPQGWMGYFGQALKTSANYLPTQVTELFHQGRAFATARLPSSGLINVCALSVIQKIPRLLVASQDGYLYIFNLDPTDSNECVLVRQHRLDGLTGDSHVTEVTPYDKPLTHQQSTTSYASTVKKQEPTVGVGSNMAPPDSEPYQEMDQGATGGDDLKGLGQLRLDDDNEFPPMTHKND